MLGRIGRLLSAVRNFAATLAARSQAAITTRSGDRLTGR